MHARRSSVSIKKASAIPTVFRPIESLPVLEDPRGHIGPVSSRAVADKAPVAVPRHKCALHWPGGRQELVQRLGRAARSRRPDRERLEPARPRHSSERLLYRALSKPSLPKRKMRPDNQLSKSPGLLPGIWRRAHGSVQRQPRDQDNEFDGKRESSNPRALFSDRCTFLKPTFAKVEQFLIHLKVPGKIARHKPH